MISALVVIVLIYAVYAKDDDDDDDNSGDDDDENSDNDDNVTQMDIIKDKNKASSFYYVDKIGRAKSKYQRAKKNSVSKATQ